MQYDPLYYGPTFSVGGITFNGSTDTNGCDWIITSGSGWFTRPAVKAMRADKPASAGSYVGDEYVGSRVIVLAGNLSALNITVLRNAISQLCGICPSPYSLYPLTCVDEIGNTVTAMVKVDGEILTDPLSATTATFSLQFFAPDPRKLDNTATRVGFSTLATPGVGGVVYPVVYSPNGVNYGTPGTPGAVSLTNNGNAYSDMVITFTGPLTIPALYNFVDSSVIAYQGTIPAGMSVVIDTSTGSVIFNGTNSRANLIVTKWPTIPPFSTLNLAFQTSNPGDTGSVSVSYTDSYY